MIIQGVFSMSILKRLKSLLFRTVDKEELDKSKDVKLSSDESDVTSSKNKLSDDSIDSETKTSEVISKKVPVTEEKVSSAKDIPSNKEAEDSKKNTTDEGSEKTEEETKPAIEETSKEKKEEPVSKIEEFKNEEHSEDEVAKEESNKKDKKSENMTLLSDTELLNDQNIDKSFTEAFVDAGIETVKHCFQCGTCGGSCPSGKRTPYKVRQIVRKCLLGLKEEVITDDALWMCTTCYTCQERCPRSVEIVSIIKKARNIAAHAGYMAKPHKMTGLYVINTGHGVPINPKTKELRARVGLTELPPTTHMFPEALKEVQSICKITGFDDLIGYDEATGELKSE